MKRKDIFAKPVPLVGMVLSLIILNGCATTTAQNPQDPWEEWNRGAQGFNDNIDHYILKPVAEGYEYVTPDFISTGVSNFFSNLGDIGVTVNDLLQLKFIQGGMDAGRFLVNSTAGVGGLIDIASMIDLPKHDEDFGQTLGYWGVPAGPYLVLPFVGSSSPRGTFGLVGDAVMNPLSYTIFVGGSLSTAASLLSAGARVLGTVDNRAGLIKMEKIATEAVAIDRYSYFRDAYIQHRRYLVYDGKVPDDEQYDLDLDLDVDINFDNETDDLEEVK